MDLSKIRAVIVCSSLNYRIPDILGSVWYSKLSDLNSNFKEVLEYLLGEAYKAEGEKRIEENNLCSKKRKKDRNF